MTAPIGREEGTPVINMLGARSNCLEIDMTSTLILSIIITKQEILSWVREYIMTLRITSPWMDVIVYTI